MGIFGLWTRCDFFFSAPSGNEDFITWDHFQGDGLPAAFLPEELFRIASLGAHVSHEKKRPYLLLYWLVNSDPYNGSL